MLFERSYFSRVRQYSVSRIETVSERVSFTKSRYRDGCKRESNKSFADMESLEGQIDYKNNRSLVFKLGGDERLCQVI